MPQKTQLIVGTDTNVGKTILSLSLMAYWQKYRQFSDISVFKLMQTGEGDREIYSQLFPEKGTKETFTPLHFKTPVAPPIASDLEGKPIELEIIWNALREKQKQFPYLIVEALGGMGTPVTHELTVADIAGAWQLPTILVVPVRLGAISQAVTSVALARHCRVPLEGIILSCAEAGSDEWVDRLTPPDLLQSFTHLPILGILPHCPDIYNLSQLAENARHLDMERLFSH